MIKYLKQMDQSNPEISQFFFLLMSIQGYERKITVVQKLGQNSFYSGARGAISLFFTQ